MPKAKKNSTSAIVSAASRGYLAEMEYMADGLGGSMDASEYKHGVYGLIFFKFISDAFEEQHAKLGVEHVQGADPEDPDECHAQNIFWVPLEARWAHLKAQAKQPTIGRLVDSATTDMKLDNPSPAALPSDYASAALVKSRHHHLIDLVFSTSVSAPSAQRLQRDTALKTSEI